MDQITLFKKRTNVLTVDLARDVSASAFVSEIREGKTQEDQLIATWDISFLTNGVDGKLILRLDNSALNSVVKTIGYMDMKETAGGEPMPVWDEPLEVYFKNPITV